MRYHYVLYIASTCDHVTSRRRPHAELLCVRYCAVHNGWLYIHVSQRTIQVYTLYYSRLHRSAWLQASSDGQNTILKIVFFYFENTIVFYFLF